LGAKVRISPPIDGGDDAADAADADDLLRQERKREREKKKKKLLSSFNLAREGWMCQVCHALSEIKLENGMLQETGKEFRVYA